MNLASVIAGSVMTMVVGIAYATIIPGVERKIHARIQRRYGPPITTPGFWNILKFMFKRGVRINSPNAVVYYASLIVSMLCISLVLLFSTPYWWGILGFSSILGVVGLLKVEEASYVSMGSFSRSVMSAGMSCGDRAKHASFSGVPSRYFEEVGASRALKMITLGSFPFYIALFVPFVMAKSVSIPDVLSLDAPAIVSLPGIIAAAVYFIGFNILTNNRPFDIIKPKVDIIEGPLMEYAASWRGMYYLFSGLLSFTLSSLFVTIFAGIPLDFMSPGLLLPHLFLVIMLPACSAVMRAFSPVFTFKQIYKVSFASTLVGLIALLLTVLTGGVL
ncbi:MAG: NADH-quinone oxidoreductase subunit H [Candidatus Altiarchaeota archaeon]